MSSQDEQTSRWILLSQYVSIDRFLTMGPHRRTKGKNAKARETSRREEGDTARAGEADEPSTSQEPEDPVDAGMIPKYLQELQTAHTEHKYLMTFRVYVTK